MEDASELFENDKENLYFKSQYAVIAMQLGDYETALTLFDELLTAMPGEPVTLTSKGHAGKVIATPSVKSEGVAKPVLSTT